MKSLEYICLDCIFSNLQYVYLDCIINGKLIPNYLGNLIYEFTIETVKRDSRKISKNSLLLFHKGLIQLRKVKYERYLDGLVEDLTYLLDQEIKELFLASKSKKTVDIVLKNLLFNKMEKCYLYSGFSMTADLNNKFISLKNLRILKIFEMNYDSSNEHLFDILHDSCKSIEELELSLSKFSIIAYNKLQNFICELENLTILSFCTNNFLSISNEDERITIDKVSCSNIQSLKIYNCQISPKIAKNFQIFLTNQNKINELNLEFTDMSYEVADNFFDGYNAFSENLQHLLLSGCFPVSVNIYVIFFICKLENLQTLSFNNNNWSILESDINLFEFICCNIKKISMISNDVSIKTEKLFGKMISSQKKLESLNLSNTDFHDGEKFFRQISFCELQLNEFSFSVKTLSLAAYDYITSFIKKQLKLAKLTIEYLNENLVIKLFSSFTSIKFELEELNIINGYFNVSSENILLKFLNFQKNLKKISFEGSLFRKYVGNEFLKNFEKHTDESSNDFKLKNLLEIF